MSAGAPFPHCCAAHGASGGPRAGPEPALKRPKNRYPSLTESVPRCTAIDPSQCPSCQTCRESVPQVTCGAKLMSPALGAPTAQRQQTQLRFEGRLGLSGLPPPEFGSPTGGLSPCHGSRTLCRPERRLRRLPAIGPLASANRSPWLQELIRHYTRIYCCLLDLKIETRRRCCFLLSITRL